MKDSPQPQADLIASRLDHLFRTVHPKSPGPYTPAEVAAAINEAAGENVISAVYVWQLRTGRRAAPQTGRGNPALSARLPSKRVPLGR